MEGGFGTTSSSASPVVHAQALAAVMIIIPCQMCWLTIRLGHIAFCWAIAMRRGSWLPGLGKALDVLGTSQLPAQERMYSVGRVGPCGKPYPRAGNPTLVREPLPCKDCTQSHHLACRRFEKNLSSLALHAVLAGVLFGLWCVSAGGILLQLL